MKSGQAPAGVFFHKLYLRSRIVYCYKYHRIWYLDPVHSIIFYGSLGKSPIKAFSEANLCRSSHDMILPLDPAQYLAQKLTPVPACNRDQCHGQQNPQKWVEQIRQSMALLLIQNATTEYSL
jgi:hypothetical protein